MDMEKMMEEQLNMQRAAFEQAMEAALEQQKKMNDEMGWETTEEARQEIIDSYQQQFQMQEAMMRQQFQMQAATAGMFGAESGNNSAFEDYAQAQMAAYQNMIMEEDDDDEISEEEWQAFLDANPVPAGMEKYLTIGGFLNSANGEPQTVLALTGDKEDYRDSIESNWGIEGRDDALEMLDSLMNGRHSEAFKKDYALIREHGTDDYFDHTEDPLFDEDDIEMFEAAVEGITDVLCISIDYVEECQSLYAWDIERIGLLARILTHVGYITEAEAYDWLKKAGKLAAKTFKSWEEYAVSLILGRALHLGLTEELFAMTYDLLTENPEFLEKHPIESLK